MYLLFNKTFNRSLHVVFPKENSLTQYWKWTVLEERIRLVQGLKLLATKQRFEMREKQEEKK